MDLIRQILLLIEAAPTDQIFFVPEIDGYSINEISYHIKILDQAGFVQSSRLALSGDEIWKVRGLTWNGHEFLDAARDETRWEKAKTVMKEKGGGMVVEILKTILIDLMKRQVLG
jgi:hypothetical protein